MSERQIVTISGFIGAEPDRTTLPGTSYTKAVYDPELDEVVDKEIEMPEKDILNFSIAIAIEGRDEPRWVQCVDWNAPTDLHSGDYLTLTGYFTQREASNGRIFKNFTVLSYRVLSAKADREARKQAKA